MNGYSNPQDALGEPAGALRPPRHYQDRPTCEAVSSYSGEVKIPKVCEPACPPPSPRYLEGSAFLEIISRQANINGALESLIKECEYRFKAVSMPAPVRKSNDVQDSSSVARDPVPPFFEDVGEVQRVTYALLAELTDVLRRVVV